MAITIKTDWNAGGAAQTPGQGQVDDLTKVVRALVDDNTELRTQFIALLTKIDADSGDTGGDSDYVSTLTPAALGVAKG